MYAAAFSPRLFATWLSTVALAGTLWSQTVPDSASYTPRLDEASVLRIAGLRMTDRMNELGYPQARLCANGVWWASQVRVGHTNRGRCRKVNGCTVVHHRTMLIDDRTGRVIERCMTKYITPNFE